MHSLTRRQFLGSSVLMGLGVLAAGCGTRASRILSPAKSPLVYQGLGPVADTMAIGTDGDYDYAVLRFDDEAGRRVAFFTPWWTGITILTNLVYVRQQFHGWPFRTRSYANDQYLYQVFDRTADPSGEDGWRFAIYQGPQILSEDQWAALVGTYGQAVDDTIVPRHGVVDFRWGPPL